MWMIPPKTKNDRFTDEQWQAIHQSGSNLLVAASAGSGKTTVLVQRIIEKIKNGTNVDELLVVTFTESAATEMKERIQIAIQEAVNSAVNQEQYHHLLRQITLLPQASISTIHAFCLKVIQRFFYLIDIDPVFRIMADTIEMEMMKEDVWEDLKEILYGEPRTFFKQLAKGYSSDRNDEGLKELIFSLYNFSRANPEPDEWLQGLLRMYSIEEGLEISDLFKELIKPQVLDELTGSIYDMEQAIHLGEGDPNTEKQREVLQSEKEMASLIKQAIKEDKYQEAYEIIENKLTFKRWPSTKKKDNPDVELLQQMKTFRDKSKADLQNLKKVYFMRPKEEQEEIIRNTRPYVEEMIRVTKLFTSHYWSEKLAGNTLDFNDLEHLTLEILSPLKDGQRTSSEASNYYRKKFEEVLIDEYQDVNKLQESILYGVTRHQPETENLFMVGDVKQSIYAFRLADPGLFLKKYQQYGESLNGERIILAENFRSRGEVISFTNFIFTQLMDKEVGQMDYDELAELKQGNLSFPTGKQQETEIMLYIKEEDDLDDFENSSDENHTLQSDSSLEMVIDDKATGEVTMVAQKIRDLIDDDTKVYDKKLKMERTVTYKDMVLLTPTKNNNLLILETFKEYGIPVILNDSQSFFQRTEISVILSLLKVIDNPRQDIALAAVLRSPLVGLNERQLAMIRIQQTSGDFLDAIYTFKNSYEERLIEWSSENQENYQKISVFLQHLDTWRDQARKNNLVHLIWSIYVDTHFLDYVGGMVAGKQRVANLHALYERAKKYEATNFKGLFQFIRFIERIQSRDQDLAEPSTFSEDEDAVRIMTIHASKGLEFPVVFVMDLSKQFNMRDIQGKYIFSEEYGIGSDYFDIENRIRFSSLTKSALAKEKKKNLLAEEMRKLYVALTRAEQKLFLIGTYESVEKVWQEWGAVDESTKRVLPNHLRLNSNTMMKWIGLALFRHQTVNPDSITKEYRGELTQYPVDFKITFQHAADILGNIVTVQLEEEKEEDWQKKILLLSKENTEDKKGTGVIDFDLALHLMESEYSHQTATQTTSYQSVSEIKRLFEDPDQSQLLQLNFDDQQAVSRYVEPEFNRPAFMQENIRPTHAEIGTAVHYVMQNLSLEHSIELKSITTLIDKLVEKGTINENVAPFINKNQIITFFQTDLGKTIRRDAELVKREVPFTMLMKAGNIFEGISRESDDHVLIHGIIDGYIEYPDHLILFDFKTDYIGEKTEMIVKKYKGQMNIYRQALIEIKGKPVTETYLCLLSSNENIILPLENE